MKPFPNPQNGCDWLTQYWNIICGRRVRPEDAWLMGPSADVGKIGEAIVEQLAGTEGLDVIRNASGGLLDPIFFEGVEGGGIHPSVVDFYTRTSEFEMDAWTRWEPVWGIFGRLVDVLFARRIDQLRLPADSLSTSKGISSEIIKFRDTKRQCRYTLWLRKLKSDRSTIYAGFYSHVKDPRGQSRVKVVFPLPHGSATVVMSAQVLAGGKLRLSSAGSSFGDPGFYFVVRDRRGGTWVRYLRCFHEFIDVWHDRGEIRADHTMLLWGHLCYSLHYRARNRADNSPEPAPTTDTGLAGAERPPASDQAHPQTSDNS